MSEFNTLLDKMYQDGQGMSPVDLQDKQRLGDDGGFVMDDYASFLDLTGAPSSLEGQPQLDPLPQPSSTTSTILSSFSDPDASSVIPGTTTTQLLSDFDFSPDVPGYGDMFPPTSMNYHNVQQQPQSSYAPAGKEQQGVSASAFNMGFGCEPAFDDVDYNSLEAHGVFGLSLFGGIPKSQAQSPPQVKQIATYSDLSNGVEGLSQEELASLIAAAQMNNANAVEDTTGTGESRHTASPQEVFALPPTPLLEVQGGTSFESPVVQPATVATNAQLPSVASPSLSKSLPMSRGPAASPAPSSTGDGNSGVGKVPSLKRKRSAKPYEPTGVRNRVLLGADAPTQTKQYLAPGSTTRKLIPVGFQKKLKLNPAAAEQLAPEDVDRELMDEIEEKRRKNCVAARESRKRKQDYLNGLLNCIGQWEEWATKVEALMKENSLQGMLPDRPARTNLEE